MTQFLAHAYKCIHIQHIPASNYCNKYQPGISTRSLPVISLSSVKAKDTNIRFQKDRKKILCKDFFFFANIRDD